MPRIFFHHKQSVYPITDPGPNMRKNEKSR
jgi:hypothetical protein